MYPKSVNKAYFDKIKKDRKEQIKQRIHKRLGKKFRFYMKHPRLLKKEQEFQKVNDFIGKIRDNKRKLSFKIFKVTQIPYRAELKHQI